MKQNLITMFKSFILTITLFAIVLLPMIPGLAFHFTMMWIIGDEDWETWQGWSNIITLMIMLLGCYFITRPGTFTYKVLRYIEQF